MASGSNDKNVIVWNLSDIARSFNDDEKRPVTARINDGSKEESNMFNPSDSVAKWTADEVANWVHQLGLPQFQEVFRSNEVDGQELLHLTHDSLLTSLKIGLSKVLHNISFILSFLKMPLDTETSCFEESSRSATHFGNTLMLRWRTMCRYHRN